MKNLESANSYDEAKKIAVEIIGKDASFEELKKEGYIFNSNKDDFIKDALNLFIDKSIKEYNSKLHVITAGDMPVNPTEMLCSSDVNELLESMKKIYDVILIDTPSLNEFADAQVLASQSDGVILVAKIGNTKKRNITEAIEKLHNVKANIVGGILNSDY